MEVERFPVRLEAVWKSPEKQEIREAINSGYLIVADCNVDTPIALLPYRSTTNVYYPTGSFETHICTPEYVVAESYIQSIKQVAIYNAAPIFKAYVTEFWKARQQAKQENNLAYGDVVKRLLNSLYGKFGQTGSDWEDLGIVESLPDGWWTEVDGETGQLETYRAMGGMLERRIAVRGESFDSFPAIAAHVTSYARCKLWEYIKQAGDHHTYYCDSDSLIVDDTGLDRLARNISNALGDLKVERQSTDLHIFGPKDYVFAGKTVLKGIRKSAVQLTPTSYRQPHFRGFRRAWRLGELDHVAVDSVIKQIRRDYKRGIVGTDGWVTPLHVDIIS